MDRKTNGSNNTEEKMEVSLTYTEDKQECQDSDSNGPTVRMLSQTLCAFSTFFCLGAISSLTAPSLLHLAELYHTDVAGMSIMFTFTSLGYLSGASLCAIFFDRASHELQYFLLNLFATALTIAIPLLPSLYLMVCIASCQAAVLGYIDSSGQSYIIRLWSNHRFKEPMMQGLHAIWSVGAFICPFIVAPFLIELPKKETTSELPNITTMNYDPSCTGNTSISITSEGFTGIEEIRFPFVIVGCITAAVSMIPLILYCTNRNDHLTKSQDPESKNERKTGEVLSFKLPILVMNFLFFFSYIWCETIPGNLLPAFVIEGLHWPIPDGPRLMSVYWGAHGIGRILGIPMSFCLKPLRMLCLNVVICILAYTVMFIAPFTNDVLIWISAALAGFSISTLFASAILWMSEYMHISGALGAFFGISASLGAMSGPPLAGFLFEHSSHMWVVILSLMASLAQLVVFVVMVIFVKLHDRKVKKAKAKELSSPTEMKYLNSSKM